MRFYIALWVGKFINFLINIIDSSRGSSFSGEKALKIDPKMVSHFKGIDPKKVLFITGTNGKSTTTNLVHHIISSNGKKICSNLEGANLIYGVATALIKASTMSGRVDADYYIFETDERFIPFIREQLPAANILITNLQKDQVQRNGDPDFIYRKIKSVVDGKDARLFINNNDPRSSALKEYGASVVTYGTERHSMSFNKEAYATLPCPKCHHKIVFDYYNNDNVGKFHCTHCGHASEEIADYECSDVDFANRSFTIHGTEFYMPYELPHMLYNYSAACAVGVEFAGLSLEDISKAYKSFKNIGGRNEVLHYKGKTITYMRFKQENPETVQTVLNMAASDPAPKVVCFGLYALRDFTPFYTNTFYLYDCDATGLVNANVEKYYCFSKEACHDTANWLMYSGVNREDILIEGTDDAKRILDTMASMECDNLYLVTLLHDFENIQKIVNQEEGGAK